MNLENYFSSEKLKEHNIERIFFYRICGTGMGAAACLLKEEGFDVEGADSRFFPPMSDYLKQTGIRCHQKEDVNATLLQKFDLIVVGNAVPRGSEDASLIESCGVPFTSFPSALGALLLEKENVVGIAGTHGKTTTTYFATQIFENLGAHPGYFIGGVIEGRPSARRGDGSYFFIESDEYDSAYFEKVSKFRFYEIDHLILTSLEFDHADIYEGLDQIQKEFRELLPTVKGHVIYCRDYEGSRELFQHDYHFEDLQEYGETSDLGPKLLAEGPGGSQFRVSLKGKEVEFSTNVVGYHNILNLTSIIHFAYREGHEISKIQEAVSELSMVKRRQEVRGYFGQALVIDDFAHHPRAVEMTIDGVRSRYPEKKLMVVMEPHSATARSSVFQEQFEKALTKADHLVFTEIQRKTSVKGAENLDEDQIVKKIQDMGKVGRVVSNLSELLEEFQKVKDSEAVILVLSNGTCLGLWESSFVKDLTKI